MDWNSQTSNSDATKIYEIKQVDGEGCEVAGSVRVEAQNGESAAKQLDHVADGAESIQVCLGGEVMNEMDVAYWQKRIRRR